MFINVNPTVIGTLDCIKKLGFPVKDDNLPSRKNNFKDLPISLAAKKDQKLLLSLSYYSDNVCQNAFIDACVSKLIQIKMLVGGQERLSSQQLLEGTSFIAEILKNEYVCSDMRRLGVSLRNRIE